MQNELGLFGVESLESAIARFKAKGSEFANAYNAHLANYNKVKDNPQLLAKWQSIKNYADKTKAVIQTINNSVDSSVNWLKDVFGMQTDNLAGLNSVGALPLIPIAYVLAGITALTYVTGEMVKFGILVSKGATVDQLNQSSGSGFFSNMSTITKWIVIGGAVYFAWKKWGDK